VKPENCDAVHFVSNLLGVRSVGSAPRALQVAEPLQGGQHLATELQDIGGLEVGDVLWVDLGLGGP